MMSYAINRQIRPEVGKETLSLAIAGDTCPRGTAATEVSAGRSGEILEQVRTFLDNADLRLVQWETPLTDADTPICKSGPNIRCAPDAVKLLQAGRFDVALLANNHIGDYGPEAVNETIARLHAAGIQTVGAGSDLAEARRPLRIRRNGLSLSILNVAEHEFGTATPATPGSNPLDIAPLLLQIARERRAGNLVLVVSHGGNEFNPVPSPRMVGNCRAFVEAGASAVVNIHTHCPQGMEVYQGAPIVYSTGNFFFPMREQQPFDPDNLWYTGYVPQFTFDRNGAVAVAILPCRFLESPWRVEPLDEKAVRRFSEYFDTLSNLIAETTPCFEAWCTIVGGWNLESIRRATEGVPFANPAAQEVRRQILPLRNLFTCEAHKEMMDTYLRLIETGRLAAAAEKAALLKQLQRPGLYTE